MKIFITGSSGFIGKNFLEALLTSYPEHQIVVLQRSTSPITNLSIRIVQADFHDVESYREELLSSEYIFHLAASADVTTVKEEVWKDYEALKEMLVHVKLNVRLKRFIFLSTIGGFDRESSDSLRFPISSKSVPSPRSEYGIVKLKSEQLLVEAKVPYTVLRPSWVWGKGMRASSHLAFFNRLIEKDSFISRVGFSGSASLVHVDDLSKALVRIIEDANLYLGRSYFAATETRKISDVLKELRRSSEKSAWLVPMTAFRVFKFLHGLLPLPINFLFFDYLVCEANSFMKDFDVREPVFIRDRIDEIKHRDQYAVITGANSGIGHELSKLLKTRFHLILLDKDTEKLMSPGPKDLIFQIDLADRPKLMGCLQTLKADRRVSLLINNAGVGFKSSFTSAQVDKDLLTVDLNVSAPIILSHHLKDDLLKTKGTILNVASSVGHFPLPYMASYAASKSFISSWSQALEEELRGKVKLITFSPSGTRTNFQNQAGVKDSNKLMTPLYVAQQLLKSILKDQPSFIILGVQSRILKMIMNFLPRKFGLKFIGKLFQGAR